MEHQNTEFGREYARAQINRQKSAFRQAIKSFYVSRILRHVDSPSIDYGCGAGQILERLPKGSIGVEINPHLVENLLERGLRVIQANPERNRFNLDGIQKNEFRTLILSHVLEHFENADKVLRQLLIDCKDIGISKLIVVVPGKVGFSSDATHKTFVDLDYLEAKGMFDCEGYRVSHYSYFPGNFRFIGDYFIYHELMFIYRLVR